MAKKALRGDMPFDFFIEPARGNNKSCIEYCSKDDASHQAGPFEWGVRPNDESDQGKRNDLHKVCDALKEGKTMSEVALENPTTFVKYSGGLMKFANIIKPPTLRPNLQAFIVWGKTNLGKTHNTYETFGIANVFKCHNHSKGANQTSDKLWFDGYERQNVLLFDEFTPFQVPLETMNLICDKFPSSGEVKGLFTSLQHEIVIICSNVDPTTWYFNHSDEQREAFFRRITATYKVTSRAECVDAFKAIQTEHNRFIASQALVIGAEAIGMGPAEAPQAQDSDFDEPIVLHSNPPSRPSTPKISDDSRAAMDESLDGMLLASQ